MSDTIATLQDKTKLRVIRLLETYAVFFRMINILKTAEEIYDHPLHRKGNVFSGKKKISADSFLFETGTVFVRYESGVLDSVSRYRTFVSESGMTLCERDGKTVAETLSFEDFLLALDAGIICIDDEKNWNVTKDESEMAKFLGKKLARIWNLDRSCYFSCLYRLYWRSAFFPVYITDEIADCFYDPDLRAFLDGMKTRREPENLLSFSSFREWLDKEPLNEERTLFYNTRHVHAPEKLSGTAGSFSGEALLSRGDES